MKVKIVTATVVTLILLGFNPFSIMRVHGNSMAPAINNGELVITVNRGKTLKVGNVVTFTQKGEHLMKRVVGIEGDILETRHGFLFRNGERVEESWASDLSDEISVEVPDGKVFVMGDNSEESLDSREFGCIAITSVKRVVLGK